MVYPTTSHRKAKVELRLATQTYSNGVPVNRGQRFDVIRPGESLAGHVQIISAATIQLERVEFTLVGIESKLRYSPTSTDFEPRTIDQNPGMSTFLEMKHVSNIANGDGAPGHHAADTVVPFVFVMPQGIEHIHEDETSSCRRYPPAFRLQKSAFSAWSNELMPLSFIAYVLRCFITYSIQTQSGQRSRIADTMTTIEYLPALNPQPPVDVSGFGSHYELAAQLPISRRYFSRRLGNVRVQTAEPKPLEYISAVASTNCHFTIDFISTQSQVQQCPITGITVHPILIATYYQSLNKLAAMPATNLASKDGPLQMYQDEINLGKSRFQDLQWQPQVPNHEHHRLHRGTGGYWRTALPLTISPPLRLVPSFLSDYTALSYSVIFRVQFEGVSSKALYLASPLQVAYPLFPESAAGQAPFPNALSATEDASQDVPCCSMSGAGLDIQERLPPYTK